MIKSLSIIFPIYNEESRLNASIKHIESFLKKEKKLNLELIFVDDGSTDQSFKIIKEFIKNYKLKKKRKIKLIQVKSNRNIGKGSALKLGVKRASCEWILTADIDISVTLFQIIIWIKKKYITSEKKVYFGSRRHEKSILQTKAYRRILGVIFSLFADLILNIKIFDTQCGYKLYKKSVAKFIFSKLNSFGFVHDLELVLLLNSKNIGITELPIKWKHKDNSRLNIIFDPIKMFIGIIAIRLRGIK